MTTQNERLRALLEKTQWVLIKLSDLNGTRAGMLYAEIDAALAEPVEDSDARIKELETLLAFQKDVNASDLRLLRATDAALDSTQVAIDRLNKEISEARAEAAAYKRDFEAELAGNAALRQKYGARENETMFDFIDRMVKERDHFKAMLRERAEALLKAQEELEQLTLGKTAFVRGAEAMREAAALEIGRLLTARKATAIWVGPDEIRAVPIPAPEEK